MSKFINLWSGPRNISTALMYSFAQRSDTQVIDEPLYAYYLKYSNAAKVHPAAEEIMNSMSTNGEQIMEDLLAKEDSPYYFIKNMTHHLPNLDLYFLEKMENIILIRHPLPMIASFSKVIKQPTAKDLGYEAHLKLIQHLRKRNFNYTVIDSKSILEHPEYALKNLCEKINIPFTRDMLSWSKGPRKEDGVWAKYWYKNVHQSTSFQAKEHKKIILDPKLKGIYEASKKIYDILIEEAL